MVSVNRDARTFRLHDSERGTIRIKVTRSTRFERISGFSGLRKGQKRIEATVRRSNGRWVATEVERSGGGGSQRRRRRRPRRPRRRRLSRSGHGPRDPDDGGRGDDLDAPVVVLQHAAAAAQQPPRPERPGQQRGLGEHLGLERAAGDGAGGDEPGPRRAAGGGVEHVVGVAAVRALPDPGGDPRGRDAAPAHAQAGTSASLRALRTATCHGSPPPTATSPPHEIA